MAKIRGFITGDSIIVEHFVLTLAQATAKEIQLQKTPGTDKIILDLPNGTSQILDQDFEVDGDKIKWDGFSLETLLAEGDNVRVLYAE